MVEDVIQLRIMDTEIRRHVLQDRIFAQIKPNHCGNVCVNGFIVSDAGADGIRKCDIAGPVCIQQTCTTEQAVVLECKWIEKLIINASIDYVDWIKALCCPRVNSIVMNNKVATFH